MSHAEGARLPACVIDASVLVKLFVPEEGAEIAVALFQNRASSSETVRLVPDLAYPECANVLWKLVRRGMLAGDLARESLADLVALPLQVWPSADLVEAAFDLAEKLNLTVYDATYLALAESMDVPLVTADAGLARKAAGHSGHVLLLSDL